jgi:hypothetical protein
MNQIQIATDANTAADDKPFKISRRSFLGTVAGALVLGVTVPGAIRPALAQAAAAIVPGTRIPAFIEIRPDSTVFFRSAFMEGGQGIFTAMAQIVGEELDVDPANFVVEAAPPGPDYGLLGALVSQAAVFQSAQATTSCASLARRRGACSCRPQQSDFWSLLRSFRPSQVVCCMPRRARALPMTISQKPPQASPFRKR